MTTAINTSESILIKAPEAAERLAISPRKLWGLTATGEIPCVRIGRSVRYSICELDRWVELMTHGKV